MAKHKNLVRKPPLPTWIEPPFSVIDLVKEGAELVYDKEAEIRAEQKLIVHASELASWCPRNFLFKDREMARAARGLVKLVPSKVPASTRFLFDRGNAYHDMIRGYIRNTGTLYGNWKCLVCKHEAEGLAQDFLECPECRSPHVIYDELSMTREYSGITVMGHCDAFIKNEVINPVVEIKSKNSRSFGYLAVPDSSHIIQMQVYLWLFRARAGCILYVGEDCAMKEYWYQWNPEFGKWVNEQLKQVSKLKDPHKAPRACINDECTQASRCPWREECFE